MQSTPSTKLTVFRGLSVLLLFLHAAVIQIVAQQPLAEPDLLAMVRAKAEEGDRELQRELGTALYYGALGATTDKVEAVNWYRKAADQNDAKAQYCLGYCYSFGHGVAADAAVGVKWFRKAAAQGYPAAQYYLGAAYFGGHGVTKDETEGMKWFRNAAEQNFAHAQYAIGQNYSLGEGVAKDSVEAVRWYRKAAEQNHASAQSNLGAALATGEGVVKDYVEAYKWRLLAAAQGNKYAKKVLPALEDVMTREQIAEGQKLASIFKPRVLPSTGGDNSSTGIAQTRPESSGTGFFITEDGYFITNEHVAGKGAVVRLVTRAGLIAAKVVSVDEANDLSLLKAEGLFEPLPVASSRRVRLGDTVATVGFPNIGLQGFAPKLAKGEIASLSGAGDDTRYFQISVPVQPGNSGGALVDERGNVVGVVSAKLNASVAFLSSGALPENVNYGIKSSYLLSFLESIPEVSAKLKESETKERKFDVVVRSTEQAAVLVLVY